MSDNSHITIAETLANHQFLIMTDRQTTHEIPGDSSPTDVVLLNLELLKPGANHADSAPPIAHRPTGCHLMMRRQHHPPSFGSSRDTQPCCSLATTTLEITSQKCLRSLLWLPAGLLPVSPSSALLRAASTVPPRWRRPTSRRPPNVTPSSTYAPLDIAIIFLNTWTN